MPGSKPCPPDCTCGHHSRPRMSREEKLARRREQNRARYARDPEKAREQARSSYWRDVEASRERQRRSGGRTARVGSAYNLRAVHGLAPTDKAAMREAQDGRCCYCNRPLPEDERKVHIDHDHSCTCGPKKSCDFCRRGLACENCNRLVGMAGDDADRLELIAANLRVLAAAARARIAGKQAQEELPPNVRRMPRKEESA